MICIFAGSSRPMNIYQKIWEINNYLEAIRSKKMVIGFVPTMGALHEGHLELIRKCKKECDITVCSIFVNPLQFNNPDDFKHYPISFENDTQMLNGAGCDLLFHPSVKEMYPDKITTTYNFGVLDHVMEAEFRPGHFNGVAIVVKRLFDIIKPARAYFGEKDYQQLLVIKQLVSKYTLGIDIIPCPIIREPDGLAMSSRNRRLSAEERAIAPAIYGILRASTGKANVMPPAELKAWVAEQFSHYDQLKPEYYELSDAQNLTPISKWAKGQEVIACVACFLGSVRLIDNIRFFPNFAA
jgi:pantoate--beta-alanine ligase